MRNEHLKVLLPDQEALEWLVTAAHLFVNAKLAPESDDAFQVGSDDSTAEKWRAEESERHSCRRHLPALGG